MSTRRQHLEDCLVLERQDLWADLDALLADNTDVTSTPIGRVIGRIRRIGEALGYPSPWDDIPYASLGWHALVETQPLHAIDVIPPPWQELMLITETHQLHPVPYEALEAHALDRTSHRHLDPGDPHAE